MDFQSQQTIAFLQAQSENMESNEDDEYEIDEETQVGETQEPHATTHPTTQTATTQPTTQTATQAAKPQRKRRKTSKVWTHFVLAGIGKDDRERAKCIHCGTLVVVGCVGSKSLGTNTMKRHIDICPNMPKKVNVYDHMVDRLMVSEAIIYHDLPFKYVEYEKVRERDRYLNPNCQAICRQTAALDVYKRFESEKEKLKELLANHHGRVCFTSDLWLARPQNIGYICLSAHYIDASWRLNAKILAFCELKSPHTGDEIASKIFESLKEWGLEKKVFSITLDNATNNTSMLRILKGKLQMTSGIGLLCEGKYMHIRCCAHILNLIVKNGLELANSLLHNIRESVRYVKASPQRKEAFAACIERVGIRSGAGLSLDVPTRWNSTYEMLARALKFRKAFVSLELYDATYKSLPAEDEWNRGEKICEFLKPFSVITTHFSGSKYPTVNIYFQQVWRIQLLLRKYSNCDDYSLREMAKDMQVKFDKYWEEYSLILSMGAVFDPRVKLEMLEAAYNELDPLTSGSKIEELRSNLKSLYEEYQIQSQASSSNVSVAPTPLELITESPLEDDYEYVRDSHLFEWMLLMRKVLIVVIDVVSLHNTGFFSVGEKHWMWC